MAHPVSALLRAVGTDCNDGASGRHTPRPDACGHHRRNQRRPHPPATRWPPRRKSRRRLSSCRCRLTRDRRDVPQRMAVASVGGSYCRDGNQLDRLAHGQIADSAGHNGGMGSLTRWCNGLNSDGRRLRSRRPPCSIHAVFACRHGRRHSVDRCAPLGSCTPTSHAIIWFPPIDPVAFAETLALAAVGGIVGYLLRFPAAVLLTPAALGAVLHSAGLMQFELPHWLLAISYALIGWMIGQTFSRDILIHALRTLLQTMLAILALIAFCGGLAVILAKLLGIDPLTAYRNESRRLGISRGHRRVGESRFIVRHGAADHAPSDRPRRRPFDFTLRCAPVGAEAR